MPIRVAINGAYGKMGSQASLALNDHPEFKLVGQFSRADNLSEAILDTKADVVVDLTRADAVFANSVTILEAGARPVIGTSGLNAEHLESLKALCLKQQLGAIIAPNFSISAVLMMQFAATAAKYLKSVEIIESHHPQKFDAPSGTAVKTAALIEQVYQDSSEIKPKFSPGVRGELFHGVPIHSLRLPGILAKQQVIFGSSGETLTISHETIDRASFMPGIILCCQKVMELKHLCYGMESFL